MIPESKKEAVARALQEAFGVAAFEDIRLLTAGLSPALVFRIVVRGCPYLMRLVVSTDQAAGPGRGDQTRHFACMRTAAHAGIAPRVWYAAPEDRVSITDFVHARPLPLSEALARIPVALRTLHASPPFPPLGAVSHFDVMDRFVHAFQAAAILPETETAELFQEYARVTSVYPRHDSHLVSSHNDLNPGNILFDGDRVWLVDWEAAFLNDRYVDLAVVANFVVATDAAEEAYLRTYFGEPAGEYRHARFYLMRQILHVAYAALLMRLGSAGQAVEPAVDAPAFRDFHERLWSGGISLATAEAKLQYARVHMNQFLENLRTPRFQDSLRIVANGDSLLT